MANEDSYRKPQLDTNVKVNGLWSAYRQYTHLQHISCNYGLGNLTEEGAKRQNNMAFDYLSLKGQHTQDLNNYNINRYANEVGAKSHGLPPLEEVLQRNSPLF